MPQEVRAVESEILTSASRFHRLPISASRSFFAPRLTHASGANTRLASKNGSIPGDSVLGLVCCEYLYLHFPDFPGRGHDQGEVGRSSAGAHLRPHSREMALGDYSSSQGHEPPTSTCRPASRRRLRINGGGHLPRRRPGGGQDVHLKYLARRSSTSPRGHRAAITSRCCSQVSQREFGATPQYHLLDEKGPITASASRSPP